MASTRSKLAHANDTLLSRFKGATHRTCGFLLSRTEPVVHFEDVLLVLAGVRVQHVLQAIDAGLERNCLPATPLTTETPARDARLIAYSALDDDCDA